MKHKRVVFSLAGFLACGLLATAVHPACGSSPVAAVTPRQNSSCMDILLQAAVKAGTKGSINNTEDTQSSQAAQTCNVTFVVPDEDGRDATKTSFSLSGSAPTIEESCQFLPQGQFTPTSFHGYNAQTYYQKGDTRMVNNVSYTYERKDFTWCMYKGKQAYNLSVWTDTQSIEKFGPAQDPAPIADVLLALAEKRLPISDVPSGGAVSPNTQGIQDGAVMDGQTTAEGETPIADDGGLFDLPLPIALGSFGVPLAGALSGAAFAAAWTVIAAAKVPPGVSEAANQAAAYAGTMAQLTKFHAQLQQIDRELSDKNIYVANPLQGDPTLIADGLTKGISWVWDGTAGWVTGSTGLTCQGYREATFVRVRDLIHQQIPGARLQNIKFEEKSTVKPNKNFFEWCDSWNDDNHDLAKLIMPDGSEWSIDFHQHNTGKHPPILRPWKDARGEWMDYMGDEFSERVSIDDKYEDIHDTKITGTG